MSIFHRVLQQTGGDQAGGVCHVDHEDGAHFVGDGTHPFPIPFTGVGGSAADDELRLVLARLALHVIIVHAAGLGIQTVGHRMIEDAAGIHR